ncbi:DUF1206 domain-containing protein [Arthrobacter sp. NQ7]|uniref:DUF1206 domain-containing protein n=1 Tax=Arthrobacter sp. NQ7 TaxID=3032303 RepID=UPI00241001BB|nr:DUF1206 domain-containing protein [Arthrobacter sp. NQ7]MDJ0455948.1 DUF1206 domain-containing protein [Arthrobacter sp. NQ7]
MSDGESTLSQAADAVEEASNHKVLDVLARAGFAVMALLHIIVGVIAIAIAFGHSGEAEATGAIAQLADNPWGPVVMWGCVVACLGLALWQASEATLRMRGEPRKDRIAKLISSGFLAIAYGSVGLSFAGFAVGLRGDSGDSTRDFSAALMDQPLGLWVLVAVGLTIIGIGVYFVVKGVSRGFKKEELFHFNGTRRGTVIDSLGAVGHVAKGVALGLTGLLFIIAAAKHSPEENTGLDGSLKALQGHPFGPTLLVAIGAGFIAYGIFALIRARFGRM